MANVERFGIEPTIENLGGFYKAITGVNKGFASVERSVAAVNRKFASLGDTASKDFVRITANVNKTATAFAKAASAQIRDTATLVKALAQYETAVQGTARLDKILQIERQRTAQATIGLESANTRLTISTNQLLAVQERAAIAAGKQAAAVGGAGGGGIGGGTSKVIAAAGAAAGKANGLFKILGNTASATGRRFASDLGSGLNLVRRGLGALVSPIDKIDKSLKKFRGRVLAVFTGVLIRDFVFGILRGIKEITDAIGSAAKAFQVLQVRFETLIAREARLIDTTLSVADSFEKTAGIAKSLLGWVKELSLVVPIDVEDIGNTLAFAQAMGFATTQAMDITRSVINYTAAMGLGSEVTERIIFNFGQMRNQGKVTSTELRDLARGAFLPLNDVMQEAAQIMGVSADKFQEFRKEMAAGKVPIDTFFKAFVQFVEKDMPGAAERMGRTFQGVIIRLKNFAKVFLGGDVLGPLFANIAGSISRFLDSLNDPAARTNAQILGGVLAKSFSVISTLLTKFLLPSIRNLLRALGIGAPTARGFANAIAFITIAAGKVILAVTKIIDTIREKFAGGIGTLGRNMYEWGLALIRFLSAGMAAGVRFILAVIRFISNLLHAWFAPGSPPQIAPLIDKWGAQTMTEYLEGWLKADFSIFNEIADKIEGFLRSIVGGIGKDNIGLVPAILGSRKAIVDAVNAVRAGTQTVDQAIASVMRTVKKISPEFKNYISALFTVEEAERRVAEATKVVEESQKRLKEAQAATRIAQEKVNAITKKYDAILASLQSRLTEVTDVFDEQNRLREIEAALASGLLTEDERRRLEAEKNAILIRQQIRDVEAQRDAEEGVAQAEVDRLELQEQAIQKQIDAAEAARAAAEAQVTAAQEQLAAAEALIDFQIKQNELLQEQLDLLERLAEQAKAGAGGGGEEEPEEGFGIGTGGFPALPTEEEIQAEIDKIFGQMNVAVTNWMNTIRDNIAAQWAGIFGPEGEIAKTFEQFGGDWDETWLGIQAAFLTVWEIIKTAWEEVSFIFEQRLPVIKGLFEDIVGPIDAGKLALFSFIALVSAPFLLLGAIVSGVLTAIQKGLEAFQRGLDRLGADNIVDMANAFWDLADKTNVLWAAIVFMWEIVKTTLDVMWSFVKGFVAGFIRFFQNLYDRLVGNSIIPDMMEDIKSIITDVMDEIKEFWEDIWNSIVDFIKDPVITTITDFVDNTLEGMRSFIVDDVGGAISDFIELYLTPLWEFIKGDLTTAFNDLKDNVLSKIQTAFQTLSGWIDKVAGFLTDVANALASINIGKIIQLIRAFFGGDGERQHGGIVLRGGSYTVGEAGRELFVPFKSGFIVPNWLTERILAPQASGNTTINNYNIEINPTYKNVQSEASLYYDAVAALAAVSR